MSNVFLTDNQVAERYGVNRVTIWRWRRNDPTFPDPINLSPGCSRFRLSDIEAWEMSKAEGAA
jgi:predicted DNA-binding transcriptional regulator AlpA